MNPLRPFLLAISRLPPAVMLLMISGVAVIITTVVSAKIENSERQNLKQNTSTNDPAQQKRLVYSRTYILVGNRIESKQVELKETSDLEAWEDVETDLPDVIGRTVKHAIPSQAQIRKIDLE